MSLDSLPKEILYLKPYLEFLSKLYPEDIHEDTDTGMLNEAVHKIADEYGDDWETKLNRDMELLEAWMEKTSPTNDYGYFILAYLSYFEKGQKTEAEIMEEAKTAESGLCLKAPIKDAVVTDEYGSLVVQWSDGTDLQFNAFDDREFYDFELNRIDHHVGKEENQIEDIKLGAWKGTRLVLQSSKPFFWKEVMYFLNNGEVYISGSASRGGNKDFDLNKIEEVIKMLTIKS